MVVFMSAQIFGAVKRCAHHLKQYMSGENTPPRAQVAIKMVSKTSIHSRDEAEALVAECTLLRKHGWHPNIVELYGVYNDTSAKVLPSH
eukprot:SAG11_NODE_1030_length_6119_cov_7.559302_4_plen_89_part_00